MIPAFLMSQTVCGKPHTKNRDCSHQNLSFSDRSIRDSFFHDCSYHDCFFQVGWKINPHMNLQDQPELSQACHQHRMLRQAIEDAGGKITLAPFVHGAFDSVFTKDNAILFHNGSKRFAYLSCFKFDERQREQRARERFLADHDFEIIGASSQALEGGDFIRVNHRHAYLGVGFRSSAMAAFEIEQRLGIEVLPLRLTDSRLYHLDTAMAVLSDGTTLACREAFSQDAWEIILATCSHDQLIQVPLEEALGFATNLVEVNQTIIFGGTAPQTMRALLHRGWKVVSVPLTEFHKAGGSAACLVSELHRELLPHNFETLSETAIFSVA